MMFLAFIASHPKRCFFLTTPPCTIYHRAKRETTINCIVFVDSACQIDVFAMTNFLVRGSPLRVSLGCEIVDFVPSRNTPLNATRKNFNERNEIF